MNIFRIFVLAFSWTDSTICPFAVHQINQLCLMRVTLNSLLRLTNLWPSDSGSNWNLEMLVFVESENQSTQRKTSRSRN